MTCGRHRNNLLQMQSSVLLSLVLFGASTYVASAQSEASASPATLATPDTETRYILSHQIDDPHFIVSIERKGPCTIPGSPTQVLRVPWQIYPGAASRPREEGRVQMQLIFDHDWCVHKATITQSSGHPSLDNVSLKWAMTVKWQPKKTLFTLDGEPTVTIPIVWGHAHDK
jgi:TonB family protein